MAAATDSTAATWAAKAGGATVLTARGFQDWRAQGGWFVLGVMGFAGAWHRSGLSGPALEAYIADMRRAIGAELDRLQALHGARLAVASGATNLGVLQVTYALCAARGICAVGIAPSAVLRYTLAPLQVVVPVGRRFGDESEVFVQGCDAFLLVGGGAQSDREARMAHLRERPITVIQGFGGAADALSAAELPGARWVAGRPAAAE